MDPDSFRKFATQVRKAGGNRPPQGFLAGGGLLVALVAGGLALNASLFNGQFTTAEDRKYKLTRDSS